MINTVTYIVFAVALVVSLSIWAYRCNESNNKIEVDMTKQDTVFVINKIQMYDSLNSAYYFNSLYEYTIPQKTTRSGKVVGPYIVKPHGVFKVGDTLCLTIKHK
jgi:hypothetical protein